MTQSIYVNVLEMWTLFRNPLILGKFLVGKYAFVYRASFCQTFSEMNAPTGEWKQIFSATLLVCTASALWMWWCEHFIFAKQLPESMTPEYKKKVIERMIKQGQQQMTGISAQYDFEEKKWKGNKWW